MPYIPNENMGNILTDVLSYANTAATFYNTSIKPVVTTVTSINTLFNPKKSSTTNAAAAPLPSVFPPVAATVTSPGEVAATVTYPPVVYPPVYPQTAAQAASSSSAASILNTTDPKTLAMYGFGGLVLLVLLIRR